MVDQDRRHVTQGRFQGLGTAAEPAANPPRWFHVIWRARLLREESDGVAWSLMSQVIAILAAEPRVRRRPTVTVPGIDSVEFSLHYGAVDLHTAVAQVRGLLREAFWRCGIADPVLPTDRGRPRIVLMLEEHPVVRTPAERVEAET